MALSVYWIRHGETDFNRHGIVQGGGIDAALNSTGEAQAQAFFDAYRTLPINAVYASALRRTQHTLAPWQKAGHTLNIYPGINELGWGDLEGQPSSYNTRRLFGEVIDAWAIGNIHARMPNGESAAEVLERVKPFIQHLEAQPSDHTLLVCTHGRLLRVILSYILHGGLEHMERFPNDNTGLSLTHFVPEQGWSAERLNCTAHLQKNGLESFSAQYR